MASICGHIAHDRIYVTAKSSTNRNFMYTTDVDNEGSNSYLLPDTEQSQDPAKLIDILISDLQESIEGCESIYRVDNADTNVDNREFIYFTALLKDVAPTYYKEEARTMWGNDLVLRPTSDDDVEEQEPDLGIWIGGEGIVTQANYDTEDNMFVQASGSKRFTFFSPTQSTSLCLYPDAHPRARKSQINFDKVENDALPQPDLILTLKAGDCLFIPAFWIHHVETLSPSVSLNLFSPSSVWSQTELILGLPTPFKNDVAMMYAFIEHLLLALGFRQPKEFVAKLVESRYASLSTTVGIGNDDERDENDDWDDDYSHDQDSSGAVHEDMMANTNNITINYPANVVHDKDRFHSCSAKFVDEFANLEALNGGIEAKELVLSHLLELWIIRVVGPIDAHRTLQNYADFRFC